MTRLLLPVFAAQVAWKLRNRHTFLSRNNIRNQAAVRYHSKHPWKSINEPGGRAKGFGVARSFQQGV